MRTTVLLTVIGLTMFGCEDPGAKVTSATVEAPAQQPANPAAAAETGKSLASLSVSPSNSKVGVPGESSGPAEMATAIIFSPFR